MLSSLYALGLLVMIFSLTTAKFVGQKHHKVRHKHNLFSLRENQVNEIREAFDEYRNALHNTNRLNEYPEIKDVELSDSYDDTMDNSLKPSSSEKAKLTKLIHGVDKKRSHYQPEKNQISVSSLPSEHFLRSKRVFASKSSTTTTVRSNDNYEDEYEDEVNHTTNRRLHDDAHAGYLHFNRTVSF